MKFTFEKNHYRDRIPCVEAIRCVNAEFLRPRLRWSNLIERKTILTVIVLDGIGQQTNIDADYQYSIDNTEYQS